MNLGHILALIYQLAIPTVITIEQVHGQQVAGADKFAMAQTALAGAASAASATLTGNNAAYANITASAISQAIQAAVAFTKVSGQYQAASALALPAHPTI